MEIAKINKKIIEFINSQKIFTAFDITKSLRNDDYYVKHGEVKSALSSFDLSSYDYTRTVSKNDDLEVKPYIYYSLEHSNSDILEYENELKKITSPVAVDEEEDDEENVFISVDQEDESEDIDDEIHTLTLDSRGRLCIPNGVIRTLFNIGDTLGILYDDNSDTTIVEKSEIDGLYDSVLTVDKSGNIRVLAELMPGSVVKVNYDKDNSQLVFTRG